MVHFDFFYFPGALNSTSDYVYLRNYLTLNNVGDVEEVRTVMEEIAEMGEERKSIA